MLEIISVVGALGWVCAAVLLYFYLRESERATKYELATADAYQVVAVMAAEADVFSEPEVVRALDYFASPNGEGLGPWPRG